MGAEPAVDRMIRDVTSSGSGGPGPGGWYSQEGDCLFFHAEDVPYHAVRLGGLVTVYEALDDDRVVGLQIKGLRSRLRQAEGFRLEIAKFIKNGEHINLAYLVSVAFEIAQPEPPTDERRLWRTVRDASRWAVPARELELVAN